MKTLLVEAQLTRMARVKDGSVNLSFSTQREIPTDEFTLMDKYWQQSGWLAFKMNEFEAGDIPTEDTKLSGQKSDSQYLRECLFAKFMHEGGNKEDFPPYYHNAMMGFAKAVNNSYDR